jgi:hypothetical protein
MFLKALNTLQSTALVDYPTLSSSYEKNSNMEPISKLKSLIIFPVPSVLKLRRTGSGAKAQRSFMRSRAPVEP